VGKTFYLKENEKLKTESGAKNNSQLPKGWEVKKLVKNNIFIRSNNMGMIINPKFSIYDKRTICTAKPFRWDLTLILEI
jgi:hypothetical protein